MHDVGYMPDTKFVLHDVEDEGNMSGLCRHMTEEGFLVVLHLKICNFSLTMSEHKKLQHNKTKIRNGSKCNIEAIF